MIYGMETENFELINIKSEFIDEDGSSTKISDSNNSLIIGDPSVIAPNVTKINETKIVGRRRDKVLGIKKIKDIFDIISKNDCADNGKVMTSGLRKIQKDLSKNAVKSWSECEFYCMECNNKFMSFKKYHSHIQNEHSRKTTLNNFNCIYCPQVCKRLNSLVMHIVHRHHFLLSYSCTFCSEFYWDLNKLKCHREEHEREIKIGPVKCERCEKEYSLKINLRKHLLSCTPKITSGCELFECDICSRKYTKKSTLLAHMNKHSKRRSYVCDRCGKNFYLLSGLRRHMILHAQNRLHICSICNRGLRTIAKFKSHVKMHEIVKPFKCKNCKQCYHDENALKLHMVGHLEMLPFPCKFCGKRFRHKGLLNIHTRIHTGQRPYACDHCKYAAVSSTNLRMHAMRIHEIDLRGKVGRKKFDN